VEEIQCAVTRELNNISKTASLEGMKKLKERAHKGTDKGGMCKACPSESGTDQYFNYNSNQDFNN
jgi:hypothetical protein